jgi:gamma-glutamylputrescine oxidase
MADPAPEQSYYRATAGGERYAALSGTEEAAICVIGGGFAGLSTALALLERGERNVLLLEAQTVGHGASGRNGGFVFGGFSLGERGLLAAAGAAGGKQLYQLTLDAVELIRCRIERYAIACEASNAGVYLANWFDDDRILDQQRRFMAEQLGVEWQHVGRADFAELARSERYFGALFEANAFHFHPLKYAQGLARALVCCGGYIEKLYPKLAGAILPIATYVMVTEPLGQRLPTAMATQAAIYDTRFAFDYYRPLNDTRLLWGGRISIRERSAPEVARLLYGDMLKVYPQLAGVRVEYAWSGMMSYGRHKMPQLGRLAEGIWYGMGFGGHGVAPTTLSGEVLARAILGDGAPLAQFAQWGLPSTGGPAGLLAAQLTYWYYELRDWMRK